MIERGQQFGRLYVLSKGGGYWICICDCGKTVNVVPQNLETGATKSCGCLRKELAAQKALDQTGLPNLKNRKPPYHWLHRILCYSAKERNLECDISLDNLIDFIEIKNCHYCDAVIEWPGPHHKKGSRQNINLDRIDNNRGYLFQNVVVCCWTCNQARRNFYTYQEWKAMTAALREYRGY
jgi:hypothetical protein